MQRAFIITFLIFSLCGCQSSNTPEPVAFDLTVAPAAEQIFTGAHYPVSIVVFPVTLIADAVASTVSATPSNPVVISAACPGADVEIANRQVAAGETAEITVTPTGEVIGNVAKEGYGLSYYVLTVTITGMRNGLTSTATKELRVYLNHAWDGTMPWASDQVRDYFENWLASEMPQLGITAQTQWEYSTAPQIGPQVFYSIMLYMNDEWEMAIYYNMAFQKVALRRRFKDAAYSYAYQVTDYTDPLQQPAAIDLPADLYRQ
jgi:hypothetical protein